MSFFADQSLSVNQHRYGAARTSTTFFSIFLRTYRQYQTNCHPAHLFFVFFCVFFYCPSTSRLFEQDDNKTHTQTRVHPTVDLCTKKNNFHPKLKSKNYIHPSIRRKQGPRPRPTLLCGDITALDVPAGGRAGLRSVGQSKARHGAALLLPSLVCVRII